ncbi:YukJ family protein [Planomonospora sp. ID82291]|nr:YukJ family protein [Planomonospora sp. ID82291]
MPLKSYGVLAGRAVERRREGSTGTPHYQLHLTDDAGVVS